MPVTIAPWLKAPDIAQDFARGAAIGAQISGERQRIQAEQARTQMEMQARQQTEQRETLIENARIQTEAAYRQTQLSLQQARLRDAQQANEFKLKQAATKAMAQQKLSTMLEAGMPLEQALIRVPELATPQGIVDAHKMALDLGTQRLEQRKLEDQEKSDAAAAKDGKKEIGYEETTIPIKDKDGQEIGRTIKRMSIYGTPGQPTGLGTPPPPAGHWYDAAASAQGGTAPAVPATTTKKRYRFDPTKGLLPVDDGAQEQ